MSPKIAPSCYPCPVAAEHGELMCHGCKSNDAPAAPGYEECCEDCPSRVMVGDDDLISYECYESADCDEVDAEHVEDESYELSISRLPISELGGYHA